MSDIEITMTPPAAETTSPEPESEPLASVDDVAYDFGARRPWVEGLSQAIFEVNSGANPDAAHVDAYGNWQLGPAE